MPGVVLKGVGIAAEALHPAAQAVEPGGCVCGGTVGHHAQCTRAARVGVVGLRTNLSRACVEPCWVLPDAALLLIHAAATWFLVGLIWMVQVVHYPLFAGVGTDGYAAYQRSHMSRITWVVAPAMFIELGAAVLLVLHVESPLAWTSVSLLGLVWLSTFAVQVPLHGKLAQAFDATTHRMLVVTNWARTLLWTSRGVIALLLLQPLLETPS